MTIITTINEVKQYVEVARSLKFETIKPSITTVERRFIKKHLSDALYTRLCDAYSVADNKVEDMPEVLIPLATLSQSAVSNIATSLLLSRLSISVSESGVGRLETESLKTAFQYQEVNAKESYKSAGYDALEDILAYLEENKTEFSEWASSPSYIDFSKYFIQSSVQFSELYNIQQSRLTFMAVRYIMKRIEDFMVQDITGKNLFKILKTQLKQDSLTEANKILLDDYICPGVALITIGKGVWERALDISDNGVTVSMRGGSENNELRQTAPLNKQQKMADQLITDGSEYLSRLGTFLSENLDDYPDYEAPTVESIYYKINNKIENGVFGV